MKYRWISEGFTGREGTWVDLTSWWRWDISQSITNITRIYPLDTMKVCMRFCILPNRRWRDISEVRRAWKSLGLTSLAPDFMAVRSRWDIKVWDESTKRLFERSRDYKYLPIFTLRMFHEFYLIVCLFLSCARRQARASRQSVCLWWIYTVQLTLWRWCLPTPSGRGTTSLWMLKKTE